MKKLFPKLVIFAALMLTGCSSSGEDTNTGGGGGGGGGGGIPSGDVNLQGLDFFLLDDQTYGVGIGNAYLLTSVTIPSSYNGKSVSTIVDYGFILEKSRTDLVFPKSITLPSSIKKIGKHAFEVSSENPYFTRGLEEIVYEGTRDEFADIKFSDDWIDAKQDSAFKVKIGEESIEWSKSFNALGMGMNYPFFTSEEALATKDVYTGGEYVCSCYAYSSLFKGIKYFYESIDQLTVANESIATVSGNKVTPIATGSTTLTLKKGLKTINVSIRSVASQTLTGDYSFDNKNVTADGKAHSLDLVKNVPAETYVYYSIKNDESFSAIEINFANQTKSSPASWDTPGTYTSYAYLYKEGYSVVKLSAILTIE